MPSLLELVASKSIQYFDCVAINIDATHNYYMTQAPYDLQLTHNGVYPVTFKAAGGLLSISEYVDNAVFSIDKLNIGIAGIVPLDPSEPSAMIQAQTLEYIDKPVTIYRAFMYEERPEHQTTLFKGYIDTMNVSQASEGDTTQVSIDISSHWTNFDRVSSRYTNTTSQTEYFPGDLGFQYSVDIQKEVTWRAND